MMPSPYYTPPPSAGTQWTQPQPAMLPPHAGPASATLQQPNASFSPSSPANSHQSMYAVMASMMQHMHQNYVPQQHHQFQQTQQSHQQQSPEYEQPKMPTPQPSDNALLAQILYEQTKRGLTYKAALESLHGHNGIMAFAWKDYFLENKKTIDDLVIQLRGQTQSTSAISVKQRSSSPEMNRVSRGFPNGEMFQSHSHSSFRPEPRPRASEESSVSVAKKAKTKEITPTRHVNVKEERVVNGKSKRRSKDMEANASSRRTLNSMSSAPSNDLLAKVPPAVSIDAHTGLPAAPSRSPSPPPPAANSRYAEQDAIFFFRRIAYDLARDPDLSKANLCDLLGEKAPHHSAVSWRSYWHKHEDVADKMYLLTQLDEEDREKAIQSWKGGASVSITSGDSRSAARRVSYKESSDSDFSENDPDTGSLTSQSEDESSDGHGEDDAQGSTDEDETLGESGSAFTMAETRALAKHIANCPDWFKGYKDWGSFCLSYPQRSPGAWKEFYRRRGSEIDDLAKKYIKKAKKGRESISAQRGRPSWARLNSSVPSSSVAESTSPVKRKFSEEKSRGQSEEKRSKMDELY